LINKGVARLLFPDKNMLSEKYTLIPDASGTLSFAYDGKRIKGELWGLQHE